MGFTPPYLEVRKISGGWSIYPPSTTTGDDLTILPNGTDTFPKIYLLGNDHMEIYTGNYLIIRNDATTYFKTSYATPDAILESTIADKNIFLKTAGTGKIKFGTHTAQADTPVTGYIDILDAAGNARKIAVISP